MMRRSLIELRFRAWQGKNAGDLCHHAEISPFGFWYFKVPTAL
jgi:hypothetical protein